ncbi:hypothetical protein D3C73_1084670 [compost metagenome]
MQYLGILVEQSLADRSILDELEILARKAVGSWNLLLVTVPEEALEQQLVHLQRHMIHVREDCWYAHFFCGGKMSVLYEDAIFHTTTAPEDWEPAVQHGLNAGIPPEQLDFEPRTSQTAYALFNL